MNGERTGSNGIIRVIDCSIRDGGLMNKWLFTQAFVRDAARASVLAGVDYVELGYKASTAFFDPHEYGAWRFSNESDLRSVWPEASGSRLSVMLDIGRFNLADMLPKDDSVVDTVRVACYVHQIEEAISTTQFLNKQGYETFINIMAISEADEDQLDQGLRLISAESPAVGIYVVDSYGNLTPTATRSLVLRYQDRCPDMSVGFHGHNNTQMALANSLAAIDAGASFVDGSLFGMGRGAGNTPLELLLPSLGANIGTIAPLYEVIDKHVLSLHQTLKWGYHLPYALSGIANQHPREAMAIMAHNESVVSSGYLAKLVEAEKAKTEHACKQTQL